MRLPRVKANGKDVPEAERGWCRQKEEGRRVNGDALVPKADSPLGPAQALWRRDPASLSGTVVM